jgi:hypothetical protein
VLALGSAEPGVPGAGAGPGPAATVPPSGTPPAELDPPLPPAGAGPGPPDTVPPLAELGAPPPAGGAVVTGGDWLTGADALLLEAGGEPAVLVLAEAGGGPPVELDLAF